MSSYSSLPPLFRLVKGVPKGQDVAPSNEVGTVPAERLPASSPGFAPAPPVPPSAPYFLPALNPFTACAAFGVYLPPDVTAATARRTLDMALKDGRIDPHHLAMLEWDVSDAVCALERQIRTGNVPPRPRLVQGRPLADWLDLSDLARRLRLCRSCGGSQ